MSGERSPSDGRRVNRTKQSLREYGYRLMWPKMARPGSFERQVAGVWRDSILLEDIGVEGARMVSI
jgi:hypothetical protein